MYTGQVGSEIVEGFFAHGDLLIKVLFVSETQGVTVIDNGDDIGFFVQGKRGQGVGKKAFSDDFEYVGYKGVIFLFLEYDLFAEPEFFLIGVDLRQLQERRRM